MPLCSRSHPHHPPLPPSSCASRGRRGFSLALALPRGLVPSSSPQNGGNAGIPPSLSSQTLGSLLLSPAPLVHQGAQLTVVSLSISHPWPGVPKLPSPPAHPTLLSVLVSSIISAAYGCKDFITNCCFSKRFHPSLGLKITLGALSLSLGPCELHKLLMPFPGSTRAVPQHRFTEATRPMRSAVISEPVFGLAGSHLMPGSKVVTQGSHEIPR